MGYSDQLLWSGANNDQRIKATAGITALSVSRARIDEQVCDLDVDLRCPGGVAAAKGWTVRPVKPYMS